MLDGASILITEDEDPLRDLYAMWLKEAGASVIEARNGDEALQKWDSTIDAVLLDRRMPTGLSGGEVLSKIREQDFATPVVMITAVKPDMDVIDMEFDNYLTKPVDKDNFLSVIEELLQTHHIRDSVREFASLGVKIDELQKAHSEETLQMHDEFQSMKRRYKELVAMLTTSDNDFSEYEKHFLLVTRERLDDPNEPELS